DRVLVDHAEDFVPDLPPMLTGQCENIGHTLLIAGDVIFTRRAFLVEIKHLHQRAFAAAAFADDTENLSLVEIERDIIYGEDRAAMRTNIIIEWIIFIAAVVTPVAVEFAGASDAQRDIIVCNHLTEPSLFIASCM